MKTRNGFVSNSSSASFILKINNTTNSEIDIVKALKIKHKALLSMGVDPEECWEIDASIKHIGSRKKRISPNDSCFIVGSYYDNNLDSLYTLDVISLTNPTNSIMDLSITEENGKTVVE